MGLFNAMWKFSLAYIIITLIFSFVLVPMMAGYNIDSVSDGFLLLLAGVFIFSDFFVAGFLVFGLIMDFITTGFASAVGKKPTNKK